MKNRMNPEAAYLSASINAAYTCSKNTLTSNDENLKSCEKYSNMKNELEPIAIEYKKNEEKLKKTNALVVESYEDWRRLQDHTMESTVANWCNMYIKKSNHIREKQNQLEENASQIFNLKKAK